VSRIKTAVNLLKRDPKKIFPALGRNGVFNWMPDKLYLKIIYYYETGQYLNLDNPVTFNEKLQWIKLYDRKPEYNTYVDKYNVRDYIKQTLGEEYLIPLIGVYDTVDEIPWDDLPNKFVLKCTHGSGSNIVCKDKRTLDIEESKRKLKRWMKKNWFWFGREWPYKNVQPRIICEKLLQTKDGRLPVDFKFHCFSGEPDNVMVCLERDSGKPRFFFFDNNWNLLRYNIAGINAPQNFTLPKPKMMDEMFKIASELSMGLPFIRVDLYSEEGKVYFGELTFFPQSGFDSNLLPTTDRLFGDKIRSIPMSKG
jgi:hypothetical protein